MTEGIGIKSLHKKAVAATDGIGDFEKIGSFEKTGSMIKSAQPKPKIPALLALALLVCGFLFWNAEFGIGAVIFTAALSAVTLIYFKTSGMPQSKTSLAVFTVMLLGMAQFALFDTGELGFKILMFSACAYIYWVAVSTGGTLCGMLSIYSLGDMINHTFAIPFGNFDSLGRGLAEIFGKGKGSKHGKNIIFGIIGLLVCLPVFVIVLLLLTSADAVFEAAVGDVLSDIAEALAAMNAMEYIFKFILGIPVAFYLCGLLYGAAENRDGCRISAVTFESFAVKLGFAPKSAVYPVMTLFNILYLTFFAAQIGYFFSAFGDVLPDGYTYAEYARRGFFELCAVAGINLGLMAAANIFITKRRGQSQECAQGKQPQELTQEKQCEQQKEAARCSAAEEKLPAHAEKPPAVLRIENAVMSVFTLLLISTAMSKMFLYIKCYGLTQLRVYTSWFMLLLFIVFAVILARQFARFNGSRIVVICAVVMFLVLGYSNPDGIIADYNIIKYEDGTLEELDYMALSTLSDGAVPAMYEHYKATDDVALKQMLKTAIIHSDQEYRNAVISGDEGEMSQIRSFNSLNLQTYKADRIRTEFSREIQ